MDPRLVKGREHVEPAGAVAFPAFWNLLGRLVLRCMAERAHGQIVLTLRDGKLVLVEVNRQYLPANLPEV